MPKRLRDSDQYDVFLSHSAKDKKVVLTLVDRLEKDGLKVWVFEREIRHGLIPTQIEAGLNASRLLLIAISKNGKGSEWMETERDAFLYRDPNNKKGSIIPLRLDDTKPGGIMGHFEYYNWIDRSQKEYSELLKSLKELTQHRLRVADHASISRVYDYFLNGSYNTGADRAVAAAMLKKYSDMKNVMVTNRAFLRRSVRYLAEAGVKQFIDIGSGLPTQGNTHEIAQAICPEARVVYVDRDRKVIEASRRLVKDEPNVRVVLGNLENPHSILGAKGMDIIDFRKPVGLLLVAIIHFVDDDNKAQRSVRTLCQRFEIGSYLVISHVTRPKELRGASKPAGTVYRQKVTNIKIRRAKEIRELFEGTTLIEPGLVFAPQWHPEIKDPYLPSSRLPFTKKPHRSLILAGVGVIIRKRQIS